MSKTPKAFLKFARFLGPLPTSGMASADPLPSAKATKATLEIEMQCPVCEKAIAGTGGEVHMHIDACFQSTARNLEKRLRFLKYLDWTLSTATCGWASVALVYCIRAHRPVGIILNILALLILTTSRVLSWKAGKQRKRTREESDRHFKAIVDEQEDLLRALGRSPNGHQ